MQNQVLKEFLEQIRSKKQLVSVNWRDRFPVNEVAVDLWSNTIAME